MQRQGKQTELMYIGTFFSEKKKECSQRNPNFRKLKNGVR
jgi:hypothetical protein